MSNRLRSGFPQIAALALMALGIGAIAHGSEAKQYATDVAAVLLLMLLAMRFRERPDSVPRAMQASAIGAGAVLVSYPAVPVAFVLGLSLAGASWAKRDSAAWRPLLALGAGWGIGAALMTWQALATLDRRRGASCTRSGPRAFRRR